MSVHIGEITSEVATGATGAPADESGGASDEWEERVRLAASWDRLERDRRRTATGCGDD